MNLLATLGVRLPILQAPMAGVSTPALAAAVTEAGGLGGVAVGHADAEAGRATIRAVRALTGGPFQVNVFCHAPAVADPAREAAWLERLAPRFARYGAPLPEIREIYASFRVDDAMLAMLLDERPAVVSFHFGLPDAARITALKLAGIRLFATATSPAEARAVRDAGVDAVVAQGVEAGGHRGIFDPDRDEAVPTLALVRDVVPLGLPVIAAGGLMDGADVAAALAPGAEAAQLGTAFVPCPESAADAAYKAALLAGGPTVLTRAISGRRARCLLNRFTEIDGAPPDYPRAYAVGKALNAAAKAAGEPGYGAWWAGTGAGRARALPAGELVAALAAEIART